MIKAIEGYENYSVDEKGNVYNTNTNKKLKWRKTLKGYCYVSLYKNNKQKNMFIHRLVALAFIPNPDELPQVNHKDENKENNCIDNLEWCTADYNTNYGTRTERSGVRVKQFDLQGNFIKEWNTIKEAATALGTDPSNISAVIGNTSKIRKSAGGYKWERV